MACQCAPALLVLRKEVDALFPNRDRRSDGCCGDAAHAARKSDHNPLTTGPGKGYACAEDIDEDVIDTLGAQELWAMALLILGDDRCKYEIYEAQSLYPDGTIKPYKGINDHRHHLHVSIKPEAVFDTRPWGIARAFTAPAPAPAPAPEEDDPMAVFITSPNDPSWDVTDGITRRRLAPDENQLLVDLGVVKPDAKGRPFVKQITDAARGRIPRVGG